MYKRQGYSGAQVGKVEMGERSPAPEFAEACDQTFPEANGLFGRIYRLARRWDGGYPSWFAEWIESERQATSPVSYTHLDVYKRQRLAAEPDRAG